MSVWVRLVYITIFLQCMWCFLKEITHYVAYSTSLGSALVVFSYFSVAESSCLCVLESATALMEDKRKKRSPKVSLPQPPPPPINPRKLSVLPASKSTTFSLGLPQPPSPKHRGKYKRSVGAMCPSKEALAVPVVPPKNTRFVCVCSSNFKMVGVIDISKLCHIMLYNSDSVSICSLTERNPELLSLPDPAACPSPPHHSSTHSSPTSLMWERWREDCSTCSTTFTLENYRLSVGTRVLFRSLSSLGCHIRSVLQS